jgi:hypothetical protein
MSDYSGAEFIEKKDKQSIAQASGENRIGRQRISAYLQSTIPSDPLRQFMAPPGKWSVHALRAPLALCSPLISSLEGSDVEPAIECTSSFNDCKAEEAVVLL